jgi:DNA-directed RNA polymerase subunit RPC12/RpoP
MATQICPNCKKDSFTWKLDDKISDYTIWDCYECNYRAYENESQIRECENCKKKTNNLMNDEMRKYWWCNNCNKIEIIP